MKNKITKSKVPTLSSNVDKICKYIEGQTAIETVYEYEAFQENDIEIAELLIVNLRNTVLYNILPKLIQAMKELCIYDVVLAVKFINDEQANLKLTVCTNNEYGIVVQKENGLTETDGDFVKREFFSKVALIHFVSTVLGDEELEILLSICDYQRKISALRAKANQYAFGNY